MSKVQLVAEQNEHDVDMVELWSEDKKSLWAIIHIDMFAGTMLYNDLNEGLEVNLTLQG